MISGGQTPPGGSTPPTGGAGTGLAPNIASLLCYICMPITSIIFLLIEQVDNEGACREDADLSTACDCLRKLRIVSEEALPVESLLVRRYGIDTKIDAVATCGGKRLHDWFGKLG